MKAEVSDTELIIEAGRGDRQFWSDLWRYRELFQVLAWRDVSARYKQTVVGALWAIIQPFITMVIMTVIFGKLAGLPSEGNAPYAIMVYAAMLPWQFFANSLSSVSQCIVNNNDLVTKVYFPRLIVPSSAVTVALVDFAISFSVLGALMVWFRFLPSWTILTLPVFILLAIFSAAGLGLFFTALTVRFRDFRFIVPFALQLGMYVSPVAYSSSIVREKFGDAGFLLYSLNPMVGVIDGFRWAILGGNASFNSLGFGISTVVACILFAAGLYYFRKSERSFADLI